MPNPGINGSKYGWFIVALLTLWELMGYLKFNLWQTNITMEHHHFLMGNLTISMAMFNSFLYVYQRVVCIM